MGLIQRFSNKLQGGIEKTGPALLHSEEQGGNARITLSQRVGEVFPKTNTDRETYGRVYAVVPSVYSVLNKKANMVASCPLQVYQKNTRTGRESVKETGVIATLLKKPNPYTTAQQFIREIVLWKGLCGRAYVVLEKLTGSEEYALVVLESPFVHEVTDPETKVKAYIYEVGGKRLYYPYSHVAEISDFNPTDFYFGLSPLEPATMDIAAQISTKKVYANEMRKGNMLGGVITSDRSLDDDAIRVLKDEWKRRTPESSRVLFLPKNMEFVQFTENSGATSKMKEILNESFDTVSQVYGMHPILFGHSNVVRPDKIESIETHVWLTTILPEQEHIAQALTDKFAKIVGNNAYLKFFTTGVPALQRAEMEQAKVGIAEVSVGKITINEWREREGLPRLPAQFDAYGDTPIPVWEQLVAMQMLQTQASLTPTPEGQIAPSMSSNVSPALPMVGTQGGRRDQSQEGEPQFIDETGKRSFNGIEKAINKADSLINKFFGRVDSLSEFLEADFKELDDDDENDG
jgi:HK97 family phage portal protein